MPVNYRSIGEIQRLDAVMDDLFEEDATMDIIAEGFDWSEGPLWVPALDGLVFSDIPPNTIYLWQEGKDKSVFLTPSGYTGEIERGGEVGSNGLILDPGGNLVLCQHGDRRMAKLSSNWDNPKAEYVTIVDAYKGKRLNSPNDAVYHSNGDLYFTDPPYGLEKNVNDPAKELDFQGVYRYTTEGELILLTDELSRPNGIAFSVDESILYVANSDPKHAVWMMYDVTDEGNIENGRVFYDATDWVESRKGLPDGLKVHSSGVIFATGPGGVWVFEPTGKLLGTLFTTQATSNCALDPEENYLYITADGYLLRIALKK